MVVEKFTEGTGGGSLEGEESEFDYDRSKWPDADTRDFYQTFPDIVPMLPAVRETTPYPIVLQNIIDHRLCRINRLLVSLAIQANI